MSAPFGFHCAPLRLILLFLCSFMAPPVVIYKALFPLGLCFADGGHPLLRPCGLPSMSVSCSLCALPSNALAFSRGHLSLKTFSVIVAPGCSLAFLGSKRSGPSRPLFLRCHSALRGGSRAAKRVRLWFLGSVGGSTPPFSHIGV